MRTPGLKSMQALGSKVLGLGAGFQRQVCTAPFEHWPLTQMPWDPSFQKSLSFCLGFHKTDLKQISLSALTVRPTEGAGCMLAALVSVESFGAWPDYTAMSLMKPQKRPQMTSAWKSLALFTFIIGWKSHDPIHFKKQNHYNCHSECFGSSNQRFLSASIVKYRRVHHQFSVV